jgi:tetrahydromethanopterin S-methyltransferase subunit G
MYKMREAWTDERMDDFRDEVNRRFDDVDKRFDDVDKRFDKVDAEFRDLRMEMNTRFDRIDARFDGLQRTMLQIAGGTIGTLIAGFAAVVATQL